MVAVELDELGKEWEDKGEGYLCDCELSWSHRRAAV